MEFTKEELETAKKIIKEWKSSGDINLISWIDYRVRKIKEANSYGKR